MVKLLKVIYIYIYICGVGEGRVGSCGKVAKSYIYVELVRVG